MIINNTIAMTLDRRETFVYDGSVFARLLTSSKWYNWKIIQAFESSFVGHRELSKYEI